MNDHDRTIRKIERNETWLASFASPTPDAVTLERVKTAVRLAVDTNDASFEATNAIARAKTAARLELQAMQSADGAAIRNPLPLWGPIGVLAASVALACSVLWKNTASDGIRDPELAAFVEVMSRPMDATLSDLFELDDAILSLTDRNTDGSDDLWENEGFNVTDDAWTDDGGSGSL